MIIYAYRLFCTFLKDLNIRQKLLLSYLVLIVIPLGILALLTYNRSSEIVSKKMMDISMQALEQVNATLGYSFQNAVKSSNIVYSNQSIQDILQRDPENYDSDSQIDDFNWLSDYFTGIQFDQSVYRIRLYMENETMYSGENVNFFNAKAIQSSELYKKAVNKDGQIYWTLPYSFKYGGFNDTQNIISGVRIINNRDAYGETIGLISIDMLVKDIHQILYNSTLKENGFIYIVNNDNQLITCSDEKLLEEKYKDIGNADILPGADSIWKKTSLDGEKVLTAYNNIPYTGWRLAAVIPISGILESNKELRNYTFILMAAIGLAAYLLALLVSGSIVKRIRRLMKTMRKAEKGDLSVKVEVSGKDEIGELEEKFNNMLVKIEDLVDEKFRVELSALQAQINPHFLYNTLELITCKALKYKAKDITQLVNLLARFYKLSLSKGKDIISIGDEIAHIETYVNIQNQRFDESIKLDVEIDERLPEYSILKLVLQPIVENAIIHGIMEKQDQTGTIRITGGFENNDILLSVTDDGVGMSTDKLENIFTENDRKDGHGFGIINVNRRLKINYGERYGLTYRSSIGQGTTVEVRIPAVRFQF